MGEPQVTRNLFHRLLVPIQRKILNLTYHPPCCIQLDLENGGDGEGKDLSAPKLETVPNNILPETC